MRFKFLLGLDDEKAEGHKILYWVLCFTFVFVVSEIYPLIPTLIVKLPTFFCVSLICENLTVSLFRNSCESDIVCILLTKLKMDT